MRIWITTKSGRTRRFGVDSSILVVLVRLCYEAFKTYKARRGVFICRNRFSLAACPLNACFC